MTMISFSFFLSLLGNPCILIDESIRDDYLASVLVNTLCENILTDEIKLPKFAFALEKIFILPNPFESFLDILEFFQINYYCKS